MGVREGLERVGLAGLGRVDPETAHGLALRALRLGLGPTGGPVASPRLATSLAGLPLPNPIGLAAGFDKNAVALRGLAASALGWVEIGAVTPRAQPGNPRPRLFRLPEDRAAINRFGFNNDGMDAVAARLERRPSHLALGINLGANKDSEDRAGDYVAVLRRLGPLCDLATVNVSSPNTERLRDLQGREALAALLARVADARAALPRRVPLLVKIAPDLLDAEIADVAAVAEASGIDAIVATNTTLSREGLRGVHREEKGGLSGAPLRPLALRVLRRLRGHTDLPLVGVGGIGSAEEALERIEAGASAVQLYTALAYGGLGLARRIVEGLDRLVAERGYATVAEAVGAADRSSEG